MKILVRKDVYEKWLIKAGFPVGTIHGFYKKVSDCPARWEYVDYDEMLKNANNNDRRAYIANRARLITDVKELAVNKKDYLTAGKQKLSQMLNEAKKRFVICKLNNRRVTNVNQKHIFKNKNSIDNQIMRVRALPFVFPIIEKYGKRGLKTEIGNSVFQEIIGKADLTDKNGNKRRCAITVIVVFDKTTKKQELTQLSVFIVDNKVIKSIDT